MAHERAAKPEAPRRQRGSWSSGPHSLHFHLGATPARLSSSSTLGWPSRDATPPAVSPTDSVAGRQRESRKASAAGRGQEDGEGRDGAHLRSPSAPLKVTPCRQAPSCTGTYLAACLCPHRCHCWRHSAPAPSPLGALTAQQPRFQGHPSQRCTVAWSHRTVLLHSSACGHRRTREQLTPAMSAVVE